MQYFIKKVKFQQLLVVIVLCRAWIDYKIQKHCSTHFVCYCLLSTNYRESIVFCHQTALDSKRKRALGTTPPLPPPPLWFRRRIGVSPVCWKKKYLVHIKEFHRLFDKKSNDHPDLMTVCQNTHHI